jgi:hypothetical protein
MKNVKHLSISLAIYWNLVLNMAIFIEIFKFWWSENSPPPPQKKNIEKEVKIKEYDSQQTNWG